MPPARTRPDADKASHPYSASHKRKPADKANAKADNASVASGATNPSVQAAGSLVSPPPPPAHRQPLTPRQVDWHAPLPAATTAAHLLSTSLAASASPTPFLQSYAYAHRLPLSSFASPLNAAVLSQPGVAAHSPTMLKRARKAAPPRDADTQRERERERECAKVAPQQLALSVRKHFNDAAVSESDVITEFVYVVKEGKRREFRMRFAPGVKAGR